MTLVAKGLLQSVWFGFDAQRLLVRVDTEGGPARERLGETPIASASASSTRPNARSW